MAPCRVDVRGDLPAQDLLSAVRNTAAGIDPTGPITNLRTMEQKYCRMLAFAICMLHTYEVHSIVNR